METNQYIKLFYVAYDRYLICFSEVNMAQCLVRKHLFLVDGRPIRIYCHSEWNRNNNEWSKHCFELSMLQRKRSTNVV